MPYIIYVFKVILNAKLFTSSQLCPSAMSLRTDVKHNVIFQEALPIKKYDFKLLNKSLPKSMEKALGGKSTFAICFSMLSWLSSSIHQNFEGI